jgi:hypothetical protein
MRTVSYYTTTMLLVGAIAAVAVVWCYLSHIRAPDGPMLFHLWGTHGVHTFDLVVLGIEAVLLVLLSITLLAGFSRRK